MGNAALVSTNLIDADGVTIVASTGINSAQDYLRAGAYEHSLWRWLASASSVTLTIDFGASVSADTLALIALTGASPTVRWRLSITDPTAVDGAVYDSDTSGVLTHFSPNYLPCVHLIPAPKTFRYMRIDISEGGVTEIGAGRLITGLRNVFDENNFQPGWSRTAIRRSIDVEGAGGQMFIDRKRGKWAVEFTRDFMTEADRLGYVEDIDAAIVNDGHLDMLWIKDVESTNLAFDSVYGYIDGDAPVTQPFTVDLYSKTYRIVERL